MNLFKNSKKTVSQTCIGLQYMIRLNEKEIEQTQYLTENYVYMEAGGKKLLYLPAKEKQFLVDTENKQLKELDLSAQMMQMNQIKAMIGGVEIKEREEGEIRYVSMQNSPGNPAMLKVDLQIVKYPELGQTVFKQFSEFQNSMQMFRVNLNDNELIKLSASVFSVNGQEQKSTIELTEIKSKIADTETVDAFCDYAILK